MFLWRYFGLGFGGLVLGLGIGFCMSLLGSPLTSDESSVCIIAFMSQFGIGFGGLVGVFGICLICKLLQKFIIMAPVQFKEFHCV